MKYYICLLCLISSLFLAGCKSGSDDKTDTELCYEKGLAAVYDITENGNATSKANTHYERSALTASHHNLPYNTRIKVTNLNNGRSVNVTINDHNMPEDEQYVIKLSEKAAKEIAYNEGQEVSIDIITWG